MTKTNLEPVEIVCIEDNGFEIIELDDMALDDAAGGSAAGINNYCGEAPGTNYMCYPQIP